MAGEGETRTGISERSADRPIAGGVPYMAKFQKVPVKAEPGGKGPTLAELGAGEVITADASVPGPGSRWIEVSLADGRRGYVHSDHLVDPLTLSVTDGSLDVLDAPSDGAPVAESLSVGDTLRLWGYAGDTGRRGAEASLRELDPERAPWARVRTPGGSHGYIRNQPSESLKAILAEFGGPPPNFAEMAISVPIALLAAAVYVVAVIALVVIVLTPLIGDIGPLGFVATVFAYFIFTELQPAVARRIARLRDPRRRAQAGATGEGRPKG